MAVITASPINQVSETGSSPHFPVLCSNLQILLPLLSKVPKIYERYKPTILVISLLIYRLGTRDCLFTTIAYDYF